jgi:Mg-chelatase subunit ChlD
MRGGLAGFYREVVTRHLTDRGRLVVVGYPRLFAPSPEWGLWQGRRCYGITRGDANMLGRVAERLNETQRTQVDEANKQLGRKRVLFVSSLELLGGFEKSRNEEDERHELCGPGPDWLNGWAATPHVNDDGKTVPRPMGSFHPRAEAHRAEAKEVADRLDAHQWPAAPTNVASPGDTAGPASTTSLVVDVSSSMEESAGTTPVRKIDAAIRAAQDVIGVVEKEGGSHGAGLVRFSTSAEVVAPITTNLASLRPAVAGFVTQSDTNVGAGLELGMQELAATPGRKTLVLLSDGKTNVGSTSTEILATVVPRARAEGIKIFTIGFGAGAEIDEDLLRSLAAGTGGEYSLVGTPLALRMALVEARYSSLGTIVGRAEGQVAQGQVVDAATFAVPAQKQELHVALAWPGSDLDPVLVDPKGRVVDERYRGARLFRDQNPEVAIVSTPVEGNWNLRVTGKDVGPGSEEFIAIASTRGQAALVGQSSGSALIPVLLGGGGTLLAGGGAGWAAVRRRRRRAGKPPAAVGMLVLRVLNGEQRGTVLAVRSGDVVGRGEDVQHRLGDETVSRRHAQFSWMEGAWAVLDLESTSGTCRNGDAVLRAHLAMGDVVTLGSVELGVEAVGHG